MRILFDQGTPVPLRDSLAGHEVATAYEKGWSSFKNGELLDAAEREGFEVMITTDSNLRHQQNLGARRISIIVLKTTSWPRIQGALATVVPAIDNAPMGAYIELEIP